MVFNNDSYKKFCFILVTLFIFVGVSEYTLIFNYFDVPKINEQHDYIFGITGFSDSRIIQKTSYVYSFDDKVISNFEVILIYVFMLWSILRWIDLLRFLVNYKND